MSIECYHAACPYHGVHYGGEGPFCDEYECRQGIDGGQKIQFVREHEMKVWNQPLKKCRIVHGPHIVPNHSGTTWTDVYDGELLILSVEQRAVDDEIIIFICIDCQSALQVFPVDDLPGFDVERFIKNMIGVLGYEL